MEEKQTVFELYFRSELKRLGLKRYAVCEILKCTAPTLKTRVENPGQFTHDEIQKLKNVGFNTSWFNF